MNWFVFAFVTWIIFGLELALLPVLDAGAGSIHPSMVIPLMAFVALYAPRKQALWAAITLGLLMDLVSPMARADGGSVVIVGPYALGYLLGCHTILAIRGSLIRRNPLTLVIIAIASSFVAQVVVIAIFTARNMGTNPLIWDASDQLVQRSFSSLYTGLSALLLSIIFFALAPTFGFHSSVPTRFARTIR
ncbi:MAG: rod shape-determining protein MreD [Phycisphaerales bacterium]|nr:rod shape-determining protein MreD [Phycisphaerales bacterium]